MWQRVPWTEAELNSAADQLERSLDLIQVSDKSVDGLAHDPHFEWHHARDQLELGTLYELGSLSEQSI
jgi:hypothetical protein